MIALLPWYSNPWQVGTCVGVVWGAIPFKFSSFAAFRGREDCCSPRKGDSALLQTLNRHLSSGPWLVWIEEPSEWAFGVLLGSQCLVLMEALFRRGVIPRFKNRPC